MKGPRVIWKEIAEKNMGVKFGAFLKFCRDNHLIPHMFNIESLQEIVKATVPPISQAEYQYFEESKMMKTYEESSSKNYHYEPSPGEPEMVFHEFVFVLGRIAESTISITDTDDPSIEEKLRILFVEKLSLRKVEVEEVLKKNYSLIEPDAQSDSSYEEESEEEYVAIDDP